MISLPDALLERIDREATRRATTRSGLVRVAMRRELEEPDPERMEAAVARSRARFSGEDRFDSAELFRSERDRVARRHL